MVKAALVFSGVPRLLNQSRVSFLNNLINENDVDVYSYIWKMQEYAAIPYCYRHREFEFVEPVNLDSIGVNKFNLYPHWYGVKHACNRFTEYSRNNNLHYDFVIRTRTDISLFHPINLNLLDPNLIYISDRHWPGRGTEIFDDNLMILSMDNYEKIYGHAYDWYINSSNRHTEDVSEAKLAEFVRELGLENRIVRSPNLDFILTRGLF